MSLALGRGFAALRVRNYRLYWIGQVVSRIGTWMQQVSLPWLVLALGGSALQLGIVAALEFTPSLLLAPFGGVYADRLDKRRAILITQLLASVQVVVLFVLTVTGTITIPLIMVLSFALGLVNAVDMPLRQSLAAELVPRNVLTNAIALNSMAFNSARVVGPAIAGITIAIGTALFGTITAGVAFNLAINAISYSAVLISLLRMDPGAIRQPMLPETEPRVLDSLREGVRYAIHTPIVLWSLTLLAAVAIFGINFRILLPLLTKDVLHAGPGEYGLLYACMGAGSLAGALTLAFMSERRAVRLMIGGGIAFGLFELALAFIRVPLLAAPALVGVGFFSMLMINTVNATIQANVTDELRGRVMALYVTVFAGSSPIGGLFAGGMAEAWGVPVTLATGAIISIAAALVVWWRFHRAASAGQLGRTRLGMGVVPAAERREPSLNG